MNELKLLFDNNKSNLMHKYTHYFDIYDSHFRRFKGKKLTVLEIGVFQGGSINLWKDFFKDYIDYYAIDINPLCKSFEQENVTIFIGSQDDEKFLQSVIKSMPPPISLLMMVAIL